ncbi:MAG: hypothetical protein KUG77_23460 [Nannocystaceae bacterium]|nr:hypothetical protein [Nannocystaceae bacterium]
MPATFDEFLGGFVLPLLGGGAVHVGRPLRTRERDEWLGDVARAGTELAYLRLRRAQELTPHPSLPEPDDEELSLWMGLHNTFAFDHPDRPRVWSRASVWRRVEGATRTLLTLPFPSSVGAAVARHVTVGAFLESQRTDTLLTNANGEHRFAGQEPPRRLFGGAASGTARSETRPWLTLPHAPEAGRLIDDALRASPLTCLLEPRRAPSGWSPLLATEALRERGLARAVVYHWARGKEWIQIGGAVMSALLPSVAPKPESPMPSAPGGMLALPGAVPASDPESLSALVGALIHLHFLKVLEFDARLGLALGSRDPGVLAFLALPLLLPALSSRLGSPLSGIDARGASLGLESFEAGASRLWTEYLDHVGELVPQAAVENLLAGLVPAIVKPA